MSGAEEMMRAVRRHHIEAVKMLLHDSSFSQPILPDKWILEVLREIFQAFDLKDERYKFRVQPYNARVYIVIPKDLRNSLIKEPVVALWTMGDESTLFLISRENLQ